MVHHRRRRRRHGPVNARTRSAGSLQKLATKSLDSVSVKDAKNATVSSPLSVVDARSGDHAHEHPATRPCPEHAHEDPVQTRANHGLLQAATPEAFRSPLGPGAFLTVMQVVRWRTQAASPSLLKPPRRRLHAEAMIDRSVPYSDKIPRTKNRSQNSSVYPGFAIRPSPPSSITGCKGGTENLGKPRQYKVIFCGSDVSWPVVPTLQSRLCPLRAFCSSSSKVPRPDTNEVSSFLPRPIQPPRPPTSRRSGNVWLACPPACPSAWIAVENRHRERLGPAPSTSSTVAPDQALFGHAPNCPSGPMASSRQSIISISLLLRCTATPPGASRPQEGPLQPLMVSF
ncbi:hypothetical protein BGZ61DRAFT_478476 [Ilyonectria robusta]|uniref:uncharacterized protein n=1 Tax=Ilyonectria robusta TaxID=1079257 RepID=UPI001E8CD8D4|nr:uncharacterized protein BGZ61DRAFT_478476 [Ilyonectria robusta]KAH8688129.1 hypothetical protein BGZ61DRAFT_478476 [Ilyonectria robusta]